MVMLMMFHRSRTSLCALASTISWTLLFPVLATMLEGIFIMPIVFIVNLSIVLTINSRYMPFQRSMLSGTEWDAAGLPYHIFALHTIWNREQVCWYETDDNDEVCIIHISWISIIWNREQDPDVDDHDQDNKYVDQFPMIMEIVCQVASTLLPGSTYITIVRDPIDLFESLWSYASKLHCHHLILAEIWQDPKSAKPCSDMSE